ncbi:MarR family transcriptional regulator, partial [Limosilactobacillus fermentum]
GPNGQGCPMHGGMGPGMMMGRHHMPPFAKPGLGHGHSREHLLVLIGKHPDGIRQKELAEGFGINQSSTSELVSKLEDDGYLKREVDPKDKRATLLFLTDLGKARAAEVEDAQKTMFEGLFKNLTAEEKQTFGDLLDKIRGDQN